LVHDEAKDKEFELEMSWIGQESNFEHLPVPSELFAEAEKAAKEAVEVE
jgi:20S proteasome subunit alpha 7